MKDAALVGMLDGAGQRGDQAGRVAGRHRPRLPRQPVRERRARAVCGGDVGDRADATRLIHRDDVGVVEPRGGVRLAEEPLPRLGRHQGLGLRDLRARPAAVGPGPRRGTRSRSPPAPGSGGSGSGRIDRRPRHPATPRPGLLLRGAGSVRRSGSGRLVRGQACSTSVRNAASRFHSGRSAGSTVSCSSSVRRLLAGGQAIVIRGQRIGQSFVRLFALDRRSWHRPMFREFSTQLLDRPTPDLPRRIRRAIHPPADLVPRKLFLVPPGDGLPVMVGQSLQRLLERRGPARTGATWLLGEGDRLARTSPPFPPDPASKVSIATSFRAARFSVARYDRRMFARRHSRIFRSQPRSSASVFPRKTARWRCASRNVSWTRSDAPSLAWSSGPITPLATIKRYCRQPSSSRPGSSIPEGIPASTAGFTPGGSIRVTPVPFVLVNISATPDTQAWFVALKGYMSIRGCGRERKDLPGGSGRRDLPPACDPARPLHREKMEKNRAPRPVRHGGATPGIGGTGPEKGTFQ